MNKERILKKEMINLIVEAINIVNKELPVHEDNKRYLYLQENLLTLLEEVKTDKLSLNLDYINAINGLDIKRDSNEVINSISAVDKFYVFKYSEQ